MTFQEQLDQQRAMQAPLPLTKVKTIHQALRLRSRGLPYTSIALVMTEYHGDSRSANAWRKLLRSYGAEPVHYTTGALRTIRRTP